MPDASEAPMSARKARVLEIADRVAGERDRWIERNRYFYEEDERYMRFLIPEGLRVLDLGCGTGRLLAALRPSRGVGVDISKAMVDVARSKHPGLEFVVGDVEDRRVIEALKGPFDVIVLSDTIGSLEDCQATFDHLHALCTQDTRIVVSYYSRAWEPLLRVGEVAGAKMPIMQQNWLSTEDIASLLRLADFEVIKREWRQLLPRRLLGLGPLVNRFVAPWPIIRRACLRNYVVARSRAVVEKRALSTTVLVPCRNERGNIEPAVTRLPRFCDDLEILFVEGHSKDGTLDEIHRVIAKYPDMDIKVMVQPGKGKGDAVRAGFAAARGDVLMILDADLTTPPEWMPKFYDAIASGKGEFANGTRLVYPMEDDAMQFLNHLANRVFSWLFSWLLNQRFTDTLCGTKVLSRKHYEQIAANRGYFGNFDPFGDFDLIFGAAKLNLKVVEIPVAYASRRYGETQISRFRHGWLLLRMVAFAFRKLKAF
jgi:SAM-dependent methyltransferase